MTFMMKRGDARKRLETAIPIRLDDAPSQAKLVRRAVVRFTTVEDYVAEIETLWKEAAESFLLIGRQLNQAKEVLPHGDFQRMIEERLPFDKSRAYQLRMVAGLVDSGRVSEDELPRSSATAFLFTSLDQRLLDRAKVEQILRPDVKRREVQEWKRRVSSPPHNAEALARARATLRAKIRRLEEELERARVQLAELGGDGPLIDGRVEEVT
jgi:hypothetical protein